MIIILSISKELITISNQIWRCYRRNTNTFTNSTNQVNFFNLIEFNFIILTKSYWLVRKIKRAVNFITHEFSNSEHCVKMFSFWESNTESLALFFNYPLVAIPGRDPSLRSCQVSWVNCLVRYRLARFYRLVEQNVGY